MRALWITTLRTNREPGRSAMADVNVRFVDAGDLRRLNRQLRGVPDGKQLGKELSAGLRGALVPARDKVKAGYLAQPAGQDPKFGGRAGQPDLRVLLAKATRIEVSRSGRRAGVRLRVDGRKMPSGMRALPRYWEGYKPRWRTPLFGDRSRWYAHRAHPLFDRTVAPYIDDAFRSVQRVAEGVRGKLDRSR
jgi:hypothetical protein